MNAKIDGFIPQEFRQQIQQELKEYKDLLEQMNELNQMRQEFKNIIKQFQENSYTEKLADKNRVINNKVKEVKVNIPKPITTTTKTTTIHPTGINYIINSRQQLSNKKLLNIFGKIPSFNSRTIMKKISQIWNLNSNSKRFCKEYNIKDKYGHLYDYIKYEDRIDIIWRMMLAQEFNRYKAKLLLYSLSKHLNSRLNKNLSNQQILIITDTMEKINDKIKLCNIHFKP